MSRVEVLPSPAALAARAAEEIARLVAAALAEQESFTLALAGGSTPAACYRQLATRPLAEQIAWDRLHIFFGDERAVPPEHPDSNFRMATETLLAHVPLSADRVHRMEAEQADRDRAAREYERLLRTHLVAGGKAPDDAPRFDLILLGIGTDGHTASIFPGTEQQAAGPELVMPIFKEEDGSWRLTMTLPVLCAARAVIFLASGAGKSEVVRQILAGSDAAPRLPAARIRPVQGELLFLLDQDAAALLEQPR